MHYSNSNTIDKALDDSKGRLAIFLDLNKVFDIVSHALLLKSLEDIPGSPLKIVKSYLNKRKQIVKVKGKNSDPRTWCATRYSVGPLLFKIYINELFHIPSRSETLRFADDTVLF